MNSVAVKYSIKDLERLSGIKAHTIRIWEQRYKLLSPERSDGNVRFYKDHDLKFLLNISVLIRNGGKISHISKLSHKEICDKIEQLEDSFSMDDFFQTQCSTLVSAMLDLNQRTFDTAVNLSIEKFGVEKMMVNLLIPFLYKIGMMWRTGESTIIQEHFITNLIRKKLCTSIDCLSTPDKNTGDTYLLFLPKDEYHDIGLLFAEYILRSRGKRVIYLGQTVPIDDIINFARSNRPDFLLTFFTASYSKDEISSYINKLSEAVSPVTLLIAGNPLHSSGMVFPANTVHLHSVMDLIAQAEPSSTLS